jgi:rod shape-determining protein MreC
MKFLPKESDIQVLDTIITSGLTSTLGLTSIYPKGLIIGTVIALQDEFSGLSKYAVIKPSVDLSGLEEVLIIIP